MSKDRDVTACFGNTDFIRDLYGDLNITEIDTGYAINHKKVKELIITNYLKQKEPEFRVRDEGIGVEKEELQDIFGAFIVSSNTRTPAGGRGVGLALCKKIIDLHKGIIYAKQNSGKGVTLVFTLPKKQN